jgi:hypothetical protein
MNTVKIHQGTGRLTGQSLCLSCGHGMRYTDSSGEHMRCQALGQYNPVIPRGLVTECSAYYNAGLPDLHFMQQTAWTLRTEKGGKRIGFAPPKQYPDAPE